MMAPACEIFPRAAAAPRADDRPTRRVDRRAIHGATRRADSHALTGYSPPGRTVLLSWCEPRGRRAIARLLMVTEVAWPSRAWPNAKPSQESISDASITMKLGTVVLFTIDRLARLRGRRCGDGAPERPYHAAGLGVASERMLLVQGRRCLRSRSGRGCPACGAGA